MSVTSQERKKVTWEEAAKLSGLLDFLKGMVDIERKVDGKKSYISISRTMESAILECRDIADRLLFAGLEEEK